MLAQRIFRRYRRYARDIADIGLRKRLQARPRPPRALVSLDDLPSQPVLVVTAHPDDDMIAAGVLISRTPMAGLICATDGAPRDDRYARHAGFDNWIEYRGVREREASAAQASLGRPLARRENLGVPDQEMIHNVATVARYLVKPLSADYSHVVTHAFEGGHPDHDAVALAVHAACALIEKSGARAPVIVEAPFYNAPNDVGVFGQFLWHEDAGATVQFDLSLEEQALKRRLFSYYVSQKDVLQNFSASQEIFRIAPRYHFSAPRHAEEFSFGMFGSTPNKKLWRSDVWKAIRELNLLEQLA